MSPLIFRASSYLFAAAVGEVADYIHRRIKQRDLINRTFLKYHIALDLQIRKYCRTEHNIEHVLRFIDSVFDRFQQRIVYEIDDETVYTQVRLKLLHLRTKY